MILITSDKLSNFQNIKAFMSTRDGGISPPPLYLNLSYSVKDEKYYVEQNRKMFFNSIDIPEEKLAIPGQIHSSTVKIVQEPGKYPDCDALITKKKMFFLLS
jgi:copper oxidase (laccase) domain-containing protein